MVMRNGATAACLAVSMMLLLGWQSPSWAQEKPEKGQSSAAEAAKPDAANEMPVPEQIRKKLSERQPAEAAELLKQALAENPGDGELQRLRPAIAMGFMRARNYPAAVDQWQLHFEELLPAVDSAREAEQLASVVQQISVFASRAGKSDIIENLSEQAIERCRKLESEFPVAIQVPLTRLIGARAMTLANSGDQEKARELLRQQIQTLQEINDSDKGSERTLSAQLSLLTIAANRFGDADAQGMLESMFVAAMEKYPESDSLAQQFAMNEYSAIGRLLREDAEQAVERIDKAVEVLKPLAERSRGLGSYLGRIESLRRRAEAAMKQQRMIGEPAPPLDIDAWANLPAEDAPDLKGKVVLYDFWAVWCGPCIATFPHLREWREEFGNRGFEIVGVTRYYGYEWDEENERIARSKEEVPPEQEREAIARFLQSKDMRHPTIFTPEGSDLQSQYAVTGIPHAVLVDRQGIVQMVKVGSGPANAEALHQKIVELIAE